MRRLLFLLSLSIGLSIFFWRNPARLNHLRDRLAAGIDAVLRIGIGA